jgi:hypothetical protein
MIHEGNVLYMKCKASFGRLSSIGEKDGLGVILIHFYVPALTPSLHQREAALQLPCNLSYIDTCHQQTAR